MLLQQLPHWQHLQAIVTPSPNSGRLVYRHAHYPVFLIGVMKYLPKNVLDRICSRAVPEPSEQPGLWQVAWFSERRKILFGRIHSLAPLAILTVLALNPPRSGSEESKLTSGSRFVCIE